MISRLELFATMIATVSDPVVEVFVLCGAMPCCGFPFGVRPLYEQILSCTGTFASISCVKHGLEYMKGYCMAGRGIWRLVLALSECDEIACLAHLILS